MVQFISATVYIVYVQICFSVYALKRKFYYIKNWELFILLDEYSIWFLHLWWRCKVCILKTPGLQRLQISVLISLCRQQHPCKEAFASTVSLSLWLDWIVSATDLRTEINYSNPARLYHSNTRWIWNGLRLFLFNLWLRLQFVPVLSSSTLLPYHHHWDVSPHTAYITLAPNLLIAVWHNRWSHSKIPSAELTYRLTVFICVQPGLNDHCRWLFNIVLIQPWGFCSDR